MYISLKLVSVAVFGAAASLGRPRQFRAMDEMIRAAGVSQGGSASGTGLQLLLFAGCCDAFQLHSACRHPLQRCGTRQVLSWQHAFQDKMSTGSSCEQTVCTRVQVRNAHVCN